MRPIRPSSGRAFLVQLAAAALLLSACSFGDADTGGPTADAHGATAAASGGCLSGTWSVDPDTLAEVTADAFATFDMDVKVTATGTSTTTFDDTTMTTDYTDQTTVTTFTVGEQQLQSTSRYDGTLIASYTATDTELTLTDVDASSLTVETTTVVDGEARDMPSATDAVTTGPQAGGTSAYTCTSSKLSIHPVTPGMDTSAYVSVLKRSRA